MLRRWIVLSALTLVVVACDKDKEAEDIKVQVENALQKGGTQVQVTPPGEQDKAGAPDDEGVQVKAGDTEVTKDEVKAGNTVVDKDKVKAGDTKVDKDGVTTGGVKVGGGKVVVPGVGTIGH